MTDRVLEDRLEALRGSVGTEDWPDVVHRAMRRRRQRRAWGALVLAAALVLLGIPALAVGDQFGILNLTASDDAVPAPLAQPVPAYVYDDVLTIPGRTQVKLAAPLNASYVGRDAPIAIPSPDGTVLLYHAFRPAEKESVGTPILRTHELATGGDVIFEEGASTAAWRADGRIAYTKALAPLYTGTAEGWLTGWFGHVFVRQGLDTPADRWTTEPSLYTVWAWAGGALIVGAQEPRRYDEPTMTRPRRLLSLTGGGKVKTLPLNGFIAVSPDGRYVVGTVEDRNRLASSIRVVDVTSGQVVAQLDAGQSTSLAMDKHTAVALGPGSWSGQSIATAKLNPYWGQGALVVLRFDGKRLTLRQELRLDREILERAGVPSFEGQSFGSPLFLGGDERELSVRIDVSGVTGAAVSVLTCDLQAESCRAGRSRDGTKALVFAVNPSRPLPSPSY